MENKEKSWHYVLKELKKKVCTRKIEIKENTSRGNSENEYQSTIRPYSIFIDEGIIADIYDLTNLQEDIKKREIQKACHNASHGNDRPYYVFFCDNGKWRAIHIRFDNVKRHRCTSFYIDPTQDYAEDYEKCLWDISYNDMVERIKHCNEDNILRHFILSLKKKVLEELRDYEKTDWGKRVIPIVNKWEVDSVEMTTTKFLLKQDEETKLFQSLLGGCPSNKLYKYCKSNTLTYILNDGTISMCSIACMNDSTECFYADNYIKESDTCRHNHNNSRWLDYLFNYKYFITSLSIIPPTKLIMWRLYGEDSKGIALEFKESIKDLANSFFIAPVSYGETNGKHPQLDFIKQLLSMRVEGHELVLMNWDVWMRFFKHNDYIMENEVRILYKPNGVEDYKWIIANGVVSPMKTFKIETEYPFQLVNIHLGPNYVEANINKELIEDELKRKGLKISVVPSEIKHYRSSQK